MYQLNLRRPAGRNCGPGLRRSVTGFDLGAGEHNCVNCANIMPPTVDPHYCARFVSPVSAKPIACFVARQDETICGLEAYGWEPGVVEFRSESVVANDLREGAGPCAECFHFLDTGDPVRLREPKRCARYVDKTTGETTPAEIVRHDESLCGPIGAWFMPKSVATEADDLGEFVEIF